MDMLFTVVAYRPNGVDVCRGCLVAQSDSDFEMFSTTNESEVVECLARYRVEDLTSDYEYSCWEVAVLQNGRTPEDDDYDFDIEHRLGVQATKLAQQKKEQHDNAEEEKQRAAAKKRADEAKQRELKELARLQEKYGDDS